MSKRSGALVTIFALLLTACTGAPEEHLVTEQSQPVPLETLESPEPPAALAANEEEPSVAETTTAVRELPTEIGVDELTQILGESLDQPVVITARTDGEFDGQSYSTTETITRDPEQGVHHVSIDFTEVAAIYDELLPQVLQAEEDSEAFEQSFATTALLVYTLASDSGEYLQTEEARFDLATGTPMFQALLESVKFASEEYEREAPDSSELAEPLDGLWLASPSQANSQPEWLGRGPFFLDTLLAELELSDDVEVTQGIDGNDAAARVSVEGLEFVVDFGENNLVRSVQVDGTASVLGTPELQTFTFDYDADTTLAQLPPQELTIDEEQFQELMIPQLQQLFPEEFETSPSEEKFQAIDDALNE